MWEKNGCTICKQWRPRSEAMFCSIWFGSALFANKPFRGLQNTLWGAKKWLLKTGASLIHVSFYIFAFQGIWKNGLFYTCDFLIHFTFKKGVPTCTILIRQAWVNSADPECSILSGSILFTAHREAFQQVVTWTCSNLMPSMMRSVNP